MTDRDRQALAEVATILRLGSDRSLHLAVPDALRATLRQHNSVLAAQDAIKAVQDALIAEQTRLIASQKKVIEEKGEMIEKQGVLIRKQIELLDILLKRDSRC